MRNKILRLALTAALVATANASHALETPRGGRFDKRIRFIDFNPAEVVNLLGHYGYSTHVLFAPEEKIRHIAVGDADAWEISPTDNHIFIKPKDEDASTNMTVVTTERIYNFELNARESKSASADDMQFQINFRYPEDEAEKKREESEKRRLRERMAEDPTAAARNWNYWAKGSESLVPDKAYDDGRFTYLAFPGNRSMPAVYVADDGDDTEALVNTHIDPERPNVIVVHSVAKRLILRKGKAATCLFNESYDPNGVSNAGGTTLPGVARVVKGEGGHDAR